MKFSLSFDEGEISILGLPYGKGAPRVGCELAPQFLRKLSYFIDTYSPSSHISLEKTAFSDMGDVGFEDLENVLKEERRFLFLGGDHSITPRIFSEALKIWPDLVYVHVDSHADYFSPKEGVKDHATVSWRISQLIGEERIYQFGLSSMNEKELRRNQFSTLSREILSSLEGDWHRIYLSIDLDVLSPGFFPSTTTPDGVHSLSQLLEFLNAMPMEKVVVVDVVEYNPLLDINFIGGKTALCVIREILGLWSL